MINLYFLNNDDEEILVKENLDCAIGEISTIALEDLKTRRPEFNSVYQRYWWDDHGRFWIDFGSHTEFYIAHEPKDDVASGCNKDYCEL